MKENRIEKGKLSLGAQGLGTVTEEMVRERAGELALINGRSRNNILSSDLEQARRELTGTAGPDAAPAKLEQIPEDERWDPVPGSVGQQAPTVPAPDEQTVAEKLVEEGIDDAEQDQMVRATRESLEREKPASEE
jgi:hypothetical protein